MTANELRALALRMPGAEERETWGHPTFRIRDKIFAGLAEDGATATVKASKEEQAALLGSDPETFAQAPYVGQHGWVTIQLARADRVEIEELVIEAWRATAPKRLVAEFDGSS